MTTNPYAPTTPGSIEHLLTIPDSNALHWDNNDQIKNNQKIQFSLLITIGKLNDLFNKKIISSGELDSAQTQLLKEYNYLSLPIPKNWYSEYPELRLGIAVVEPQVVTDSSSSARANEDNQHQGQSLAKAQTPAILNTGKRAHGNGAAIADATSAFVTLQDAIKLNYSDSKELHSLLVEVITSCTRIINDFSGRGKLVNWLIKLNKMKEANVKVNAQELEQLLYDIQEAYWGFYDSL
ncbi:ESCRT-I subunit protein [Martiniozyma asiatica (nom. inval.)]|nr:ESCRT-I subunit protein [Martiniozyma asiatica]